MTEATTALGSTRAMATDVTVHGLAASDRTRSAARRALEVFHEVETACTRFDPASPLMRMNARPSSWHQVPETLFRAMEEAHRAHQRTKGRFDPRVLRDLVGLGYDRSLAFSEGSVRTTGSAPAHRPAAPWRPRFRGGPSPQVLAGPDPVDLGGVGKGLAIRWAAERLEEDVENFLIEAGGDIACRGTGPEGEGWSVGVEDPFGGDTPLVVVALTDAACATSSVRLRRWRCAGSRVHHLIDPRSGRPGGRGLLAVTVIGPDPVDAEVLSKTLFLEGRGAIGRAASRQGVAAFWVDTTGVTGETPSFGHYVTWRAA